MYFHILFIYKDRKFMSRWLDLRIKWPTHNFFSLQELFSLLFYIWVFGIWLITKLVVIEPLLVFVFYLPILRSDARKLQFMLLTRLIEIGTSYLVLNFGEFNWMKVSMVLLGFNDDFV
jgi:hypothetical protein